MQTENLFEPPQVQSAPKLKKKRYSIGRIIVIALILIAILNGMLLFYYATASVGLPVRTQKST